MDIGSRVGPYEIRERIGEGGMAVVYKVWHTGLHRFEALKVPRFQGNQSIHPDFIQRLLNEARIAAQLHHPHIVAIHNVSEPESAVQFFAMDLVEGRDLAEVLQDRHQLPLPEVIAIMRQVASALDYAHSRGFIHRDIKPGNILLGNTNAPGDWNAKVVDFGISRAAEDSGGTRLTKSGMIVGTPEYMSPEQAGSGAPVDYRTDIYSLGIVAYEMLAGHPPFTAGDGVSRMSILLSHVHHLPRPLAEEIPALDQAANNAVLKALAKAPDERFASCAEFIRALAGEVLVAAPAPAESLTPSPLTPLTAPRPESLNTPPFMTQPQATALDIPVRPLVTAPEMAPVATPAPRLADPAAALDTAFSPPTAPSAPHTNVTPGATTRTAERVTPRKSISPLLLGLGVVGVSVLGAAIFAFTHNNGSQTTGSGILPTPSSTDLTPAATVTAPTVAAPTPGSTHVAVVAATPQAQRTKLLRAIPFPIQVEKTAALPLGQQKLKQAGQTGQKEVTVETVKQGSQQLARRIVGSRTIKAPVPQIELRGTAAPKVEHPAPHHATPHRVAPRHPVERHPMPRYHPPVHRAPARHSAAPHHVHEAPLPP